MSLLRAAALGAATGARATVGITAVALGVGDHRPGGALGMLTSPRGRVIVPALAIGELIYDKLPQAPSRTDVGGLVARAVAAGMAATALAERDGEPAVLPAAMAGGIAVAAAHLGRRFRAAVAARGRPDLPAAVAEDCTSAGLAWAAVRT